MFSEESASRYDRPRQATHRKSNVFSCKKHNFVPNVKAHDLLENSFRTVFYVVWCAWSSAHTVAEAHFLLLFTCIPVFCRCRRCTKSGPGVVFHVVSRCVLCACPWCGKSAQNLVFIKERVRQKGLSEAGRPSARPRQTTVVFAKQARKYTIDYSYTDQGAPAVNHEKYDKILPQRAAKR